MSRDAANQPEFSQAVRDKMRELAELVAREQYGPDGVPLEITFSQIEQLGHQVGRLTATTFDQTVQHQHTDHFQHRHSCPQCGNACSLAREKPRELQTLDGSARLEEPEFFCTDCQRSFFPSTGHSGD